MAGDERCERVIRESGADLTCQRTSEHQLRLIQEEGGIPERGEPSPRASQITLYVVTFPAGIF